MNPLEHINQKQQQRIARLTTYLTNQAAYEFVLRTKGHACGLLRDNFAVTTAGIKLAVTAMFANPRCLNLPMSTIHLGTGGLNRRRHRDLMLMVKMAYFQGYVHWCASKLCASLVQDKQSLSTIDCTSAKEKSIWVLDKVYEISFSSGIH